MYDSYLEFLDQTYPPTYQRFPRHIRQIAEAIDRMDRGEYDRLAIHMPPRHGKSETVSVRYPVYHLAQNPTENVLVTGYNQRFAGRFGRRTRNLAEQIGLSVNKALRGNDEWGLLESKSSGGGILMTRGVGSPPTGVGFHRIIIDDPIKSRKEAHSLVHQTTAKDWYFEDILSRLEPRGKLMLVMTRWHVNDLARYAFEAEPDRWHVLNLPALDGRNRPLWPERFDVAALERRRQILDEQQGAHAFSAMYQQNPAPTEGGLFQESDFSIVETFDVPRDLKWFRGWDVALSARQSADETVGTKLAIGPGGAIYIMDQVAFRGEFPDVRREILRVAEMDGARVPIGIERPLAGLPVIQDLQRDFRAQKFAIWPIEVKSRDKKTRAQVWASRARGGRLFLVRGPWNQPFIRQCVAFKGVASDHDDRVDSVSVAMDLLTFLSGEKRDERLIVPGSPEYYRRLTRGDEL